MKKSLVLVVLVVLVLGLMATQVFAENKFVGVSWWGQPDPSNPEWTESADGSLTVTDLGSDNTASIAFVPPEVGVFDVDNFVCEVEMTIPDASTDGWSGLYFRASQAASGFGGFLIHMNTEGLAILDGENGIPIIEERIHGDKIKPNAFNHVKVSMEGKKATIWLNGESVFTKNNVSILKGVQGVTTVNSKATYKNYKLTYNNNTYECFTVAAKEKQPAAEKPAETEKASTEKASTETAVEKPAGTSTKTNNPKTGDAGVILYAFTAVASVLALRKRKA